MSFKPSFLTSITGKLNRLLQKPYPSPYTAYYHARKVPSGTPLCIAPWTSVNFTIDGYATVCCLNRKTSIRVSGNSIDDIWKSAAFKELRTQVKQNNLEYDCGICSHQLAAGNYTGVKALAYDSYYPTTPLRPQVMEFCLDNTCNLACTMCNSMLSSTIRQQQKLPRFHPHYGSEFVQQLNDYIPYLKAAVFSGGEPFLVPLYFEIWENILRINPSLCIHVVTNGTTLNSRIKDLLERGNFQINVSIDAVDKVLYESIRVNAQFETVMQNFEWLREYGVRKGNPINIPCCPLTLNWQNIPEVVRFANKKNVSTNFVYVDRPLTLTLTNKNSAYLQNIISYYNTQAFEANTPTAVNNIAKFKGLINDVTKWQQSNLASGVHPVPQLFDMENYSSSLQNLIQQTTDPDIKDDALAKHELFTIVDNLLSQLPVKQRYSVFERLQNTKLSVIYNHVKDKNVNELVYLFNEYTGNK
jgi:sulfatase maturation enzyme AslB (radical SAM superfamily)